MHEIVRRIVIGVYSDGFIHAGNLAYVTLLALFPWLRTERGVELAGCLAEHSVLQTDMIAIGFGVHAFVEPASFTLVRPSSWWSAGKPRRVFR